MAAYAWEMWASPSAGFAVASGEVSTYLKSAEMRAILISSVASLDLVLFRAGTGDDWKSLVPRCVATFLWNLPDTVDAGNLDKQCSGGDKPEKIACPHNLH